MTTSLGIPQKGDYIVHTVHGVGKVMGVEEKEIGGKKKRLFKVKTSLYTYWIPVNAICQEKVRKVCSPRTFQNMLSLIRKKPEDIAEQYGRKKRKVTTTLVDSSLSTKARLIRDLHGCQVRRELNFNDQMMLEKLKQQFVEEWAVASGLKKSLIMKKLEDALEESAEKIIGAS